MATVAACPLCSSPSATVLQVISYRQLTYLYRKLFDIAIDQDNLEQISYLHCPNCQLRFFSPAICGDGKFYESLQKFPWYYLEDRYEFQAARRYATSGMSVLEIGCGSGMFAASLPPGCSYRGLEFNAEAIRKARARGLQVDDTKIESLVVTVPGTFDMVCAFQVLEHVPNPATLLSGAAQLLKPGGRLVIAVPSEDSYVGHELNNLLNMPPHHLTRWCDAALVNAAQQCGVRVIQVEHEPLGAMDVAAYARASVLSALTKVIRIRLPLISRFATSRWLRWPLSAVARPIAWRAASRRQSLRGHSVIAIYEKQLPSS